MLDLEAVAAGDLDVRRVGAAKRHLLPIPLPISQGDVPQAVVVLVHSGSDGVIRLTSTLLNTSFATCGCIGSNTKSK